MSIFRVNPCRDTQSSGPLSFPSILEDPMVRALMRADHVDTDALMNDLKRIAETIAIAPESAELERSTH
jgi:hypothetical protein